MRYCTSVMVASHRAYTLDCGIAFTAAGYRHCALTAILHELCYRTRYRPKVNIPGIIFYAYVSVGTACCLLYCASAVPLLQHAVVEFTHT